MKYGLAVVALALATLAPAGVQAGTPLESWKKAYRKIAPQVTSDWAETVRRAKGLCVCTSEETVGDPPVIIFSQPGLLISNDGDSINSDGVSRFLSLWCNIPLFDHATEELLDVIVCPQWLPLPK